jgi:hypothetical protein
MKTSACSPYVAQYCNSLSLQFFVENWIASDVISTQIFISISKQACANIYVQCLQVLGHTT